MNLPKLTPTQRWRIVAFAIVLVAAAAWLSAPTPTSTKGHTGTQMASPKGDESSGLAVGQPVPDFELVDLDGKTVNLSSLAGRALVMNFWATWCAPCRAEMPLLQSLQEEHKDAGLVVLGVNVAEPAVPVRQFLEEQGITYPVWVDPAATETAGSPTMALFSDFGGLGLPTTYFVSADGTLTATHIGEIDTQALTQKVNAILASVETEDIAEDPQRN